MSEPAKDEAELLDQVVVATCECHPGECYVKMGQMLCCAEDDKVEAVFAAIRAAGWAVVPVEPTDSLLMSMALRADHALGCSGYYDVPGGKPWQTHARRLEMAISEARKQHEEVVGMGFYKPEHDDTYRAMLAAAPGVET
jgi:hypothetical protein